MVLADDVVCYCVYVFIVFSFYCGIAVCDLVVLYGGWFWGGEEYTGVIGFLYTIWGECVVVAILLDFYCIQVGCFEGVVLNGIIVRGVY